MRAPGRPPPLLSVTLPTFFGPFRLQSLSYGYAQSSDLRSPVKPNPLALPAAGTPLRCILSSLRSLAVSPVESSF